MSAISGIVLGPMEIANEYGTIHIFKNSYHKGEEIWIYYDSTGHIKNIEPKRLVEINKPIIPKIRSPS